MKEHTYTAYVVVSIPVGLVFDHKPTKGELREAAIENFMDHPALKDAPTLDGYVDEIDYEECEI